jgi:hypothetical protein
MSRDRSSGMAAAVLGLVALVLIGLAMMGGIPQPAHGAIGNAAVATVGPVKPKVLGLGDDSLAQHMAHVNGQRGAAVLAIVLDGVRAVVQGARLGDKDSILAVKELRRLSTEIAALAAIERPGGD